MKRLLLIGLLVLAGLGQAMAQHQLYADDRRWHFGFSLGIDMMDFRATSSDYVYEGNQYEARAHNISPAFAVGLITNLNLCKYLDLRFTPTLHFGERTVSYKRRDAADSEPNDFKTSVVCIPMELPLWLKYSSQRNVNARPYLLAGGGVSFELGRDKEKPLLQKTVDYYVGVGAGCDIYFRWFKLAPELRFQLGFNDMLTHIEDRPELLTEQDRRSTALLKKLMSRSLTLTFNFE